MRPPCTNHRVFIQPTPGHPDTLAAQEMCTHCPLRQQCATDGLTSGESIDGTHVRPAHGVIIAGVVCHGDMETAYALATIANTLLPTYDMGEDEKPRTKRRRIDDECVNCHKPMVKWTRRAVPDGYVMHHARGYCTECRAEYRAAYPPTARPRSLRKHIDRKRHSAPPARKNEVQAVQMGLFTRREVIGA